MSRDHHAGGGRVKRTGLFNRALKDLGADKQELSQPNYEGNVEEVVSQRNSYPYRRSNYNGTNHSAYGAGKPYYERRQTPDRRGRQCFSNRTPRKHFFPQNKFNRAPFCHHLPENHITQNTSVVHTSCNNLPFNDCLSSNGQSNRSGTLAALNACSVCTPENSSISGLLLDSGDKTVPPHDQVECDSTGRVISSHSTELHKDVLGLRDGSSCYESQEDGSVSSGSCYKPGEIDADFVPLFGSCDLGESLSEGYIPPPTLPSNLSCGEPCSKTVESSSYHEENGDIPPPPVSDIQDSSIKSSTIQECSATDSALASDLIQTATSSECERVCHFNPTSLNIVVTVPVEDGHNDEYEETSEEMSSVQDSLNGMDTVPEQIEAISKLLTSVESERASVEYKTWEKVKEKVTRVIKKCIPGCWLEPFGSYVSGFAIGTSNMNFALIPSKHIISSHKMLQEMVRPIRKEIPDCDPVYDGSEDYRKASVSFFEPDSNIFCKIQILGNSNICRTAKLLHRYVELDRRVKTLVITVRHWAETCDIHEEENGRLHPLNYVLMVIHFLQQCDPPVLPVLDLKRNLEKMEALQDKQEVGYLWVEFLKYYSETFNWKDHVVSITSKAPVLKASKPWGKCWIAVEEPHDDAVNVAKSVISQDVSNYIRMVFMKTYNYFLHPVSQNDLDASSDMIDDTSEVSIETNEESQPNYDYEFYQNNFLNGLCVPVVCSDCEHLGHLCDGCLHDENSMLYSLPEMTLEFLQVIDKALNSVYEKNSLSEVLLNKRESLVERLEKCLRKRLKCARVELIGSSKNGFGLKDSDVDTCFTLEGFTAVDVDAKTMVRKIKNILLSNQDFTDVMFIASSKIPIVKFIDKKTKLRCDISIYNELAAYNTRLLNAYSRIDERVKILGCAMKNFAKNACINDTAQRTLSSYSYILMVLYFLQKVEPPVIPVLQELYDSNEQKPVCIVENEDVWFFEDIKNLSKAWDGLGKNQQSVGELWVGLLEFYTAKFDFHHFISISQMSPLEQLKNVSSSMLFNIQDPFIKNLNLGSRMSGDMSRRTLKALQRARILFGTPVPTNKPPSGFESFQDYLFSTLNLTDGKVQGKIECSLCGKFGHSEDKCRRHKLNPNRLWCNVPQKAPFHR